MIRNVLVVFFMALTFSVLGAQDVHNETPQEKVEKFILESKKDSATYYLKTLESTKYTEILEQLIAGTEVSYEAYYVYTTKIGSRRAIPYKEVSAYIDKNVGIPDKNEIDWYYFKIKWTQIYKFRDEISIDGAAIKQKQLQKYVARFSPLIREVKLANLSLKRHPILMYIIEKDLVNGKELVLKCIEDSKVLKDVSLEIMFLYLLNDFLLLEGKLQEYIDASEKSLELEKQLPSNSTYHSSIVQHLIDAYIYQGGKDERVNLLIDELYEDPVTRINTYSLYLKLISYSKNNTNVKNEILEKFKVSNVLELVEKFKVLGKDLNPNNYFIILNQGSRVLAKEGLYVEAIKYKDEAILLTRKIYSEDLSKSLANFKIEQAEIEKVLEIGYEKKKTKIYILITVIAGFLLFVALLVIKKLKKQSKELASKNKLIKKTLKEKELLVKEVHHRVKNNFQIVSSLLELQSKGIEDEKALEMANEGKNRVKSMALIHQKLYQNNKGLVNFQEYLEQLTKELSTMYASKNNVVITILSENIFLDVDTAIPLGLIINEIITNSFKYAFNNEKKNKLLIKINKEKTDDYKLIIQDNGYGLETGNGIKETEGLGLRLVNGLVKQLHGTLLQTNNEGAKFEIVFKGTDKRKLVD